MNININKFNIIKVLILSLFFFALFFFGFTAVGSAQTVTFTKNLSWNTYGQTSDVKLLQQFLTNEGLYSGPISGIYLSLTYKAVQAFQKREGISPASGYFGTATRTRANEILTSKTSVSSTVTTSTGVMLTLQASVSRAWDEVRSLQRRVRERTWGRNSGGSSTTLPQPTPAPVLPTQTPTPPQPTPQPTPVPPLVPPPTPVLPSTSEIRMIAYITGYTYWDNTPPGSADISHPIIHQKAGGTGTYADPITLAVGHSIINGKRSTDYPPGTRFYLPNLRRYFIMEDVCGDGNTPQNGPCHNLSTADRGAQTWLDLWIDGRNASKTISNNCAEAITANHLVIQNPAPNYVVSSGPVISGSSCPQQYGDTLVTQ